MKYDRFTTRMQEAVVACQDLAAERDNQVMEVEHFAKVLLEQKESFVPELIRLSGGNLKKILTKIEESLKKVPGISGAGSTPFVGTNLKKVLEHTFEVAKEFKDKFVSTEHGLISIVEVNNSDSSKILKEEGVTKDKIISNLSRVRGNQNIEDQNPEEKANALKKYSVDLTEMAAEGKLDPVIGRDEEVRRVIQVLSRRTKNNPVLIGEPGVGKTAIIEGLAQKIYEGDVPESLKKRRVISLNIGSLLAGAMYRGQFEERVKSILREISDAGGDIILFIDELHTIVGAGRTDGAMDASNMFKPALARGELRCVGATTLKEYRENIEKDAALERRFQKLIVNEPDEFETIAILRGLKGRYEIHHGIKITDEAIIAAVRLSNRYITDRFLPDKAIDLMDEAASKLRMEVESTPHEIEDRMRKITKLQVEASAIKNEKTDQARQRLEDIENEIEALKAETEKLKIQWQNEKHSLTDSTSLKEELERLNHKLAGAEKDGDYEEAGRIKYSLIPELEKKLADAQSGVEALNGKNRFLREEIDENDIAKVVSGWTGIPVSEMLESEKEKLLRMEEVLNGKVIGQKHAIEVISNAVRRSRSGLKNPGTPIGTFIFLGPTGVGKTETARCLAEFLFSDINAMIRIDMSEYMERHSVSRLIGAPPGYVGYDQGGQLTEAVRRRPYSIILFDEIEKAHTEVFNIFLQVLDEGALTDGQGRRVDFKNTIIIMTSNIGSDIILEKGNLRQDDALRLMRKTFKPEFLNRIDDIVVFNNLEKDSLKRIVDIEMLKAGELLKEKRLSLEISGAARDKLLEIGFDPSYGARPLKRAIQKFIINPLAEKILGDQFRAGDRVKIDSDGDDFIFKV